MGSAAKSFWQRGQQTPGGTVLLGACMVQNQRQLSAGIVLLKGYWKQGEGGDLPTGPGEVWGLAQQCPGKPWQSILGCITKMSRLTAG